jgi:hypothetical protein
LSEVLALLRAKRTALNILVLDACRNNPLSGGDKGYGGQGLTVKGLRHGDPRGETLIGFATAPGRTVRAP